MTIRVKRVTETTLDSFFALFSKTLSTQFPEYSQNKLDFFLKKTWSKKRYRKLVKSKNRLLLGAWVKNQCVGIFDAEMPFGGVSLGIWLMVDPSVQKQGVGKKLLEKWEEIVKKRGGHSLYLYADKRNVEYYKKQGFTLFGVWEKSWFGVTDYVFTKLIQEPEEKNFLK